MEQIPISGACQIYQEISVFLFPVYEIFCQQKRSPVFEHRDISVFGHAYVTFQPVILDQIPVVVITIEKEVITDAAAHVSSLLLWNLWIEAFEY